MNILTPIPDLALYQTAIVILLSLGCSNIASHIHSRWFSNQSINVIRLHNMVKLIIIVLGVNVIPIYSLFDSPWYVQWFSAIPAALLAIFSLRIEYKMTRNQARLNQNHRFYPVKRHVIHKSLINKAQGMVLKQLKSKVHLKNIHEHHARLDSEMKYYHLYDIIFIAIFEEIIYRGFLWKLSLQLPSILLINLSLLTTVILFGASHITLGKGQFFSKTVLGFFCLIQVLITHSVFPAIITHMLFNIYAYKEMIKYHAVSKVLTTY